MYIYIYIYIICILSIYSILYHIILHCYTIALYQSKSKIQNWQIWGAGLAIVSSFAPGLVRGYTGHRWQARRLRGVLHASCRTCERTEPHCHNHEFVPGSARIGGNCVK